MKVVLKGLIGLGIILLLGTAGASDYSNIPFEQMVFQAGIAVGFIAIGSLGLKWTRVKYHCIHSVKVNEEPKLGRVA
jgi:hypothetical protein